MNIFRIVIAVALVGLVNISAVQAREGVRSGRISSAKNSRADRAVIAHRNSHSAKARRNAKIERRNAQRIRNNILNANEASAELPSHDDDDNDVQDDEIGSGSLMGTPAINEDNGGGG